MKKLYRFTNYFLFLAILAIPVANLQAQTYASVPYSTGFESGSLGSEWTATSSLSTGQIFVTGAITATCTPHTGSYFLGMHHPSTGGGSYNLNDAKLHLNLAGQTNMRFEFWWAEWNDETEPQDGIYLSDDGGLTYVKILDLFGASYTDLQWYYFNIDLDSAASANSLNLTSTFIIKFTQYDNYYFNGGNDGHMYDDLNIYPDCISTNAISVSQCTSYVSPGGNTYTSSGTYTDTLTNAAGCDSLLTINLTVGNSYWTGPHTVCDSFVALSGTATYYTSGMVYDTIPNSFGCDSIFTINLTVKHSSSANVTVNACESYQSPGGNTYTTSGTYMDTIANATGCDSIITTNLTITNIDTSVVRSSLTLSSNETGGTYQWIDCTTGAPLSGAIAQSFIVGANGDYAVIITKNQCSDTSSCYTITGVGVNEAEDKLLRVYPNPAQGQVFVEHENNEQLQMRIYNHTGEVIQQSLVRGSQSINMAGFAAGVYTFEFTGPSGIYTRKVVLME